MVLLFKKSSSPKERTNSVLSNLRRNAYAMSMLRSRLESRINYMMSLNQGGGECQELARVLELVKNGEMILHEISGKIESARFLEEFVTIMDSVASSLNNIRGDLEEMVLTAEASLKEMHEAITKVSVALTSEIAQQVDPAILVEVTSAIEASKAVAPVVEVVQHMKDSEERETVSA